MGEETTYINTTWKTQELVDRDQEKVLISETLDNIWTGEIDFWFEQIKEGYIVEFVTKTSESFSNVKIIFEEGPRIRSLVEIPLFIIILFVKNKLNHMELDKMLGQNPPHRGW